MCYNHTRNIDPLDIILQLCRKNKKAFDILVHHGRQVVNKAVTAAEKVFYLNPDINFIRQAGMLHDIGMILTNTPELGCYGKSPYICHGYLGRKLLEKYGLPRHALVCERHVGVGLSADEIKTARLPLPPRDMIPVSIEEQVICFADKFYSKNGHANGKEKPIEDIQRELERFGKDSKDRFGFWLELFGSE